MFTAQGLMAASGAAMRWKASHVPQPPDSQPLAYEMSPEMMTLSISSTEASTCVMVLFASPFSPMSATMAKVYG